MMGGHWFETIFGDVNQVTDNQLLSTAIEAAQHHLGIKEDPARYIVTLSKVSAFLDERLLIKLSGE